MAARSMRAMPTPLTRRTTDALGLHSSPRVDAALWQQVEIALDQVGQLEAVLGDVDFELIVGELCGGRSVRPGARVVERVGVMRGHYQRDERERAQVRAGADEAGCRRLLGVVEMTFAGLPTLGGVLDGEQFCRYLSVGVRDQLKMTGFLAEVRSLVRQWINGRQAA